MTLEFGLDPSDLGESEGTVAFELALRRGRSEEILLAEVLSSSDDELWLTRELSLEDLAYESAQVCLSIGHLNGDRAVRRAALWGSPLIRSRSEREQAGLGDQRPTEPDSEQPISQEEMDLRRRQLEALGYVN